MLGSCGALNEHVIMNGLAPIARIRSTVLSATRTSKLCSKGSVSRPILATKSRYRGRPQRDSAARTAC